MLVTKKALYLTILMFSLLAQEVSAGVGGFARLYPNAKFADIRGNVGTRLKNFLMGFMTA